MATNRDDLHPVSKAVTALFATAVAIYGLVCTWLALVGGTAPITGWQFEGNLFHALGFLFFVEPIITTVGFWLAMIVVLPIDFLLRAVSRR